MPELSLAGVVVVAAVAFLVPLLLGLFPGLRLPSVVLEIVVGIVLGPWVLGWVRVDVPLQVLSLLGLAFLLFLAGLEIDVHQLRGRLLGLVGAGFAASFAVGLAVAAGLGAVGLVDTPLLVAIILTATSLGVVIPVLKDAGQVDTGFGQLVVAAASIADFGAVILLSLFFSRDRIVEDVAWSYRTPLPESQKIAGLVAFDNERVDLFIADRIQERPVTKFSK